MKAIIPVAGAGAHLRPLTFTQPKALLPLAGKPMLGHIVDGLRQAGIQDFVFVIGYLREKIHHYVQASYGQAINAQFVVQEPRMGIGHAISLCRQAVGDDDVVIALGDTLFDLDLPAFLNQPTSAVAVFAVDDPRQFGVAVVGPNGRVRAFHEKPTIPKSNQALVGLYKVRAQDGLFDALDALLADGHTSHGQYQLTDALMRLLQTGVPIQAVRVNNWHDCGRKEQVLETNRLLLDRLAPPLPTGFPEAVFIPPVVVHPSCTIRNAVVGPYVVVDQEADIANSILNNALIGAYTTLRSIVLKDSIVGSDSSLTGRWHAVNIGDNTAIDFS